MCSSQSLENVALPGSLQSLSFGLRIRGVAWQLAVLELRALLQPELGECGLSWQLAVLEFRTSFHAELGECGLAW